MHERHPHVASSSKVALVPLSTEWTNCSRVSAGFAAAASEDAAIAPALAPSAKTSVGAASPRLRKLAVLPDFASGPFLVEAERSAKHDAVTDFAPSLCILACSRPKYDTE